MFQKKLKRATLTNLEKAPRGLRYATKTIGGILTKILVFSEFDSIPEPPRKIQIVEREDPY